MRNKVTPTIKDKMIQRQDELTTAFTELVDTIERYFTISAFEWFKDEAAEPGAMSFPKLDGNKFGRFTPYTDRWMGMMLPETNEIQHRINEGEAGTDEYGELAFQVHEYGFFCGVLVGSRYMGASRDQLLNQCRTWSASRLEWEERTLIDEEKSTWGK